MFQAARAKSGPTRPRNVIFTIVCLEDASIALSVRTIDFIYFDAGGGHRAAATALKAVVEQQQRPWNIRLVNLQEVLDPLDVFRKVTGIRLQDIYNLLLQKGWTLGSKQLLPMMQMVMKIYHQPGV